MSKDAAKSSEESLQCQCKAQENVVNHLKKDYAIAHRAIAQHLKTHPQRDDASATAGKVEALKDTWRILKQRVGEEQEVLEKLRRDHAEAAQRDEEHVEAVACAAPAP